MVELSKKYIMMEIKSQNQKCIKEKIKKIHAFSDSNCQSKSPQKIMKVRKFNLLKKFAFLVQRSTKLEFYEMATVYIFFTSVKLRSIAKTKSEIGGPKTSSIASNKLFENKGNLVFKAHGKSNNSLEKKLREKNGHTSSLQPIIDRSYARSRDDQHRLTRIEKSGTILSRSHSLGIKGNLP